MGIFTNWLKLTETNSNGDFEFPEDLPNIPDGAMQSGGDPDDMSGSGLWNLHGKILGKRTKWLRKRLGGLGGYAMQIADLNLSTVTSFNCYLGDAYNNPYPGTDGQLLTIARSNSEITQIAFAGPSLIYHRTNDSAGWTNWNSFWVGETAVHDFTGSVGYQKLPSGLMIQWGGGTGSGVVNFPIAFPNSCLSVMATENQAWVVGVGSLTKTGFTSFVEGTDGSVKTNSYFYYLAFGY